MILRYANSKLYALNDDSRARHPPCIRHFPDPVVQFIGTAYRDHFFLSIHAPHHTAKMLGTQALSIITTNFFAIR